MTVKEYEKHKLAADRLDLIKDRAFGYIKKNIGRVTEYDINKFILSEFKKDGLVTDYSKQIVAVNENTASPHYFPKKGKSFVVEKNCLVLIDIWARLKGENSPFADITWVGYTGKDVPKEIEAIFKKVAGGRDFCLKFLENELKNGKLPETKEVDDAVCNYFGKMKEFFIHGTGHSLGIEQCHGKTFRFSQKTDSQMKKEVPFTIEPGLYFKGKFGIRSEIDCWIDENLSLEVTTSIQREIVKI